MQDLISRQDAIAATMETVFVEYEDGDPHKEESIILQTKAAIRERIKALPPVYVPDMNVGDMISRDAAMERLMAQNVIMEGSEYHNGFNAGVNRAQEVIRNLPSVQPDHNAEVSKMEIIHCENCEHWDTSWETVYGLHYCPMIDMATKKNFFCKYGAERKGDTE